MNYKQYIAITEKTEVVNNPKSLSTEELETYIESRYEANAPQEELDRLETIYDGRVTEHELDMSEDHVNMTEEELGMSETSCEGTDIDKHLAYMYPYIVNPEHRYDYNYDEKPKLVLDALRDYLNTVGFSQGGLMNISNEQIFDAAKEAYINEYKRRKKIKGKVNEKEYEICKNYTFSPELERDSSDIKKPISSLGGVTAKGTPMKWIELGKKYDTPGEFRKAFKKFIKDNEYDSYPDIETGRPITRQESIKQIKHFDNEYDFKRHLELNDTYSSQLINLYKLIKTPWVVIWKEAQRFKIESI